MSLAWDDLRFLLAVHERKSFLSAAQQLNVATSTVIRRVEALESAVGRKLVERRSDGARMTPQSTPLVGLALDMRARIDALRWQEGRAALEGVVRLSMDGGSSPPITRILCEYRQRVPETIIEVVAEMRLADLSRREVDLAFRSVRSKSRVLVERTLGRIAFGLYCVREYAERRLPSLSLRPGAFGSHDFVGKLTGFPQQLWLVGQGANRFTFRSDSMMVQRDAALRGAGIILMARLLARETRELLEIRTSEMFPPVPMMLVYHREIRSIPHIAALARYLEAKSRDLLTD